MPGGGAKNGLQLPPLQRRVQCGGQQGEPGFQALRLCLRVILAVGHKVIVLALVQPGNVFSRGPQPVVGGDGGFGSTGRR